LEPDATSLVDVHNHLVPGVDDGARHMDDVYAAVERMTRAGIRRIVTTPHIRAGLTLDPSALERRLGEVERAWALAAEGIADAFPEVEYRQGHEIALDVPTSPIPDSGWPVRASYWSSGRACTSPRRRFECCAIS